MFEPEDAPGHLPSPYAGTVLQVKDHLSISAFWFGSNFIWGSMLPIVLPKQVEQIVPEMKAQAIGFVGIVALVALVVPLITGAFSDRCKHRWGRRRPYMLVGAAINIVGLALMLWAAFSKNLAFYLGAYCVMQFGNNVASGPYSGLIPDVVPEDQRGKASGYMGLMSQAGTLLGILVSMFLIGSQPILLFAIMGLVLAGSIVVSFLGIKEGQLTHELPPFDWGTYLRSLWISPREYPDFAWVWLTRFLVMMGFYSIQPFALYYFNDVLRIERDKVELMGGIFFATVLLFASISGYFGGHLSDRIGRKKVVYVANGIIAAVAVGLIFARTLPEVYALGVVFGLGFGAYISVDWALGTDVLPSKTSAAKDMAVWHISMVLPQALTQPIAGFMLASFLLYVEEVPITHEKIAHYTPTGYGILFGLAAVYFTLGAVLLRNVKKAT